MSALRQPGPSHPDDAARRFAAWLTASRRGDWQRAAELRRLLFKVDGVAVSRADGKGGRS